MVRLPGPLKKRQLVYGGKTPPEELSVRGRGYLEEGRTADALDFLTAARDIEGLAKIARTAIEEGDAFLLWGVQRAAPELVSSDDWEKLARAADALGKDAFAARARAGGAPPPPPFAQESGPPEETETPEEEGSRPEGSGSP